MAQARDTLRRVFGYPDFRGAQADVVASILSGADTLAVLPTGGGKSVCYQVPALLLPGMSVVVSPLISLMTDQVDRLRERGVSATLLNSTIDAAETRERLRRIARGELTLLYVAPERFASPALQEPLLRRGVSLLAVDEAHCISEWGHEFRPAFRRIADVAAGYGAPPVLALTATATPLVRRDIARQLRMRSPRVIVAGFDRPNLSYAVTRCRSEPGRMRALVRAVRSHSRPAVVYAATRATVNVVRKALNDAGIRAAAYHGGQDPLRRRQTQESFMRGRLPVIVATNAFGMGVDKADVRLVVHHTMPGTLESYYQEAGRAGRDGNASHCLLLYHKHDRRTHEWFLSGMFPDRSLVERVYAELCATPSGIHVVPGARQAGAAIAFLARHGAIVERRAAGRVVRVEPADPATRLEHHVDWRLVARRRDAQLARLHEMEEYACTRGCRRAHALSYFGDTRHPDRCTGCDNCAGGWASMVRAVLAFVRR